jgi:hypothetical protein
VRLQKLDAGDDERALGKERAGHEVTMVVVVRARAGSSSALEASVETSRSSGPRGCIWAGFGKAARFELPDDAVRLDHEHLRVRSARHPTVDP